MAGFLFTNPEQIYTGVVFNPIDGYTYLAKMQIGWSGDWLFTLPFTAKAGDGRLLYPFYITAGHILNLLHISIPIGFNLLRLMGYGFLLFMLQRLTSAIFSVGNRLKSSVFFLMAVGGGLGWLLLPFGKFGADFWVAEAFPFLSGLANAHFPLAIGLFLVIIVDRQNQNTAWRLILLSFCGLLLSVLSPFGYIVAAGVMGGSWLWEKLKKMSASLLPVLTVILSGAPYSIYQYWAVNSTPQLAAWTAQNQTPSPQVWDVILSFSPWLLLIVFCWRELIRSAEAPVVRRLIVWFLLGLILTIIPFNLQRRFMFGLSVPVTCLGMLALPYAAEKLRYSMQKMNTACLILVLPTPILLLVMTCSAIAARSPLYFIQRDEMDAIQWLSGQENGRALVLASDQTGSLLPAFSRLRVLYGHPFETIDADKEKDAVDSFYSGTMSLEESRTYLISNDVDWILYGPREKAAGLPVILNGKQPHRQMDSVGLFYVKELIP